MATVKISQLPVLSQLSANNANTVFVVVDRTTNTTSQFSTTVLAQGLYANNILNVGTANTGLLLPNSVAQFISNTEVFSQVNFQNLNAKGSADIVITSDDGDNSNNYLDLGVQGSNMDADPSFDLPNNDGYLYMHGTSGESQGNLWIGTATSNTDVVFFTGAHKQANEIGRFENGVGLSLKMPIKFADNTIQNTAAVTAAHSQVIYNQANSAYNFAIDVNTYAAAIYALANTQSNSISVIQGVNTTQNTNITTANNQAWAAFDTANTNSSNIAILQAVNTTQNTNITTANNHAWAAFTKANNALANTTGIFDGTLTITGDLEFDGTASIQATDDMFIGSNSGIQIQTDNGGTQKQFQFGIDGNLTVPNYIVFPDNTEIGYNPSASPTSFMVSTANTLTLEANTYTWSFGQNGTTTFPTNITIDYSGNDVQFPRLIADSGKAFSIQGQGANGSAALSWSIDPNVDSQYAAVGTTRGGGDDLAKVILTAGNTTATLKVWTFNENGILTTPGNVDVVGNLTTNGTVVLANSNFGTTEAAFRITGAGSSQTPTQSGTLMQLTSKANTPARVLIDSFGISNTAYPIIAGRNARGTVDAPTATQNNDILLRIAGNSYGTTGYAPFGDARIDFVASENHTDTARGSKIRFWNTPTGSNVVNEIASFNADSVEFTGTVKPDKGFIYVPTILVGNQTAFTIDFSTTSLIKATLAADCTITLSNYIIGKVVEVWLTNTSGLTRTITHGCTATNSSENATTFTMPGTSSAYLRYFSIDGDNANTFVTVQHA
jgi:hypothetical protein